MSADNYLEFLELERSPFLLAPDPDFLYLSTQHSLAQAYLNYALLNRDGFVVITGETGSGKTILINKLLAEMGDHVVAAHIFQTQVSPVEFLQSMLLAFGVDPFGKEKVELLTLLNMFIVEQQEEGRQVVLIVDDAHNLSREVLEEIRLVSEVDTGRGVALNVILCGRPVLVDTLAASELEQLAQRIRFKFHVNALSLAETEEYIHHRMQVAGRADSGIVQNDALAVIYRYTGGIPRLINILCDTALTTAFTQDLQIVDERVIEESIAELDWVPFPERREHFVGGANGQGFIGANGSSNGLGVTGELPGIGGRLVLSVEGTTVDEFTLRGQRLLIGRDQDNDIQIPADYVSRHHAQISESDGACWLVDLNSTNGSYVNGRRIKKRILRDGDEIHLGRHKLTYVNPLAPGDGGTVESLDNWRDNTMVEDIEPEEALEESQG